MIFKVKKMTRESGGRWHKGIAFSGLVVKEAKLPAIAVKGRKNSVASLCLESASSVIDELGCLSKCERCFEKSLIRSGPETMGSRLRGETKIGDSFETPYQVPVGVACRPCVHADLCSCAKRRQLRHHRGRRMARLSAFQFGRG